MDNSMSWLGAISALLLPALLGTVWVYYLLRRTERWNWPAVIGQGYLVGLFATALLIKLWDFTGLPLNYWGMASIEVALILLGIGLIRRQQGNAVYKPASSPMATWQKYVIAALAILLLWRYSTLLQELLLRPLFPWDGWMNWAPKAIVWFHYKELVPFVSPEDWLNAPATAMEHTQGAWNAWKYPVGVPLIQLWVMLGAGTSDHTVIYLPWFYIVIAMGLALYGHLQLNGSSVLASVVAVYLLLSIPFVNVHVALAGYADLWVAAVFSCSIFALSQWYSPASTQRNWPYALLAFILAAFCAFLKMPGLVMAGIIFAVFITAALPVNKWLIGLVLAISAGILLLGIEFSIPSIGDFVLSNEEITIPYLGTFELAYHPVHRAFLETLFIMPNWNLLWYVFLIGVAIQTVRTKGLVAPSIELRAIIATLLFIGFVYYFTKRYEFAVDQSQVSRALLYAIPLLAFYLSNQVFNKYSRNTINN